MVTVEVGHLVGVGVCRREEVMYAARSIVLGWMKGGWIWAVYQWSGESWSSSYMIYDIDMT